MLSAKIILAVAGATVATAALAQIGAPGGSANPLASQSFTASDVDPANPFGGVNVRGAETSNASMSTFVYALTGSQRTELTGRCGVIIDPGNSSRYEQNARDFCRSYMAVASSTNFGATGGSGASGPSPNVSGGGGGSPGPTGPGANGTSPNSTAGTSDNANQDGGGNPR
jgi:hypothetical protein